MSGYRAEFRDDNGYLVAVEESVRSDRDLFITGASGSYFTKEQAPALALAVLEAAGYTGDHDWSAPEIAVDSLKRYVKEQAAAAQEAADKEALTAEAEALWAAFRGGYDRPVWAEIKDEARDYWRAVARKARELHLSPCESEEAK